MQFGQAQRELWRKVVIVHFAAKRLMLLAEETDEQFRTFLPPFKEQHSALDHLCRAQSVLVDLKADTEDYTLRNLDRALGHEYRAFFDTADWLALTIRKSINDLLTQFSNNAIQACIPAYYSTVRPRLETIAGEIAAIRGEKDIGTADIIPQIEKYEGILKELRDFWVELPKHVGGLEDWSKRQRREARREHRFQLWLLIAGALLGALLTYAVGALIPDSEPPPTKLPPKKQSP